MIVLTVFGFAFLDGGPCEWVIHLVFVGVILVVFFFFSSRRRHTRYWRDWSSDVCSSDLRELYLNLHIFQSVFVILNSQSERLLNFLLPILKLNGLMKF